ncbi:MAG: hypothetical protein AAGA25_16900 [Planctomycetota bacterium]
MAFSPSIRPVFEPLPEPEPLDPEDEFILAQMMASSQYQRVYAAEKSGRNKGGTTSIRGLTPKTDDAKPKRPHPRTMSKAEQVAEIVEAWPKLNAHETAAVLGALRRCPSIAGRTHVSKMAKATRGQHLVHHTDAAKQLGIKPNTLHAWAKRGWIGGKVRVSNNVWYPRTEVTKARKLAVKRRK